MPYRDDPVLAAVPAEALQLWRSLAGDPTVLAPGTRRALRGTRGFCPSGWVGVVRLGTAWAVESGEADDHWIARLLELDDPTEPDQVSALCCPEQFLGPAELAYLAEGRAVPPPMVDDGLVLLEREAAELRPWLDELPAEDVEESSVADMEQVIAAFDDPELAGVVGHLEWPERIAHIGLVVAPAHRRRGVGRRLAIAGTARALEHGLAPQWRAASGNVASRGAARAAGYVEVGRQLSFRWPTAPSS